MFFPLEFLEPRRLLSAHGHDGDILVRGPHTQAMPPAWDQPLSWYQPVKKVSLNRDVVLQAAAAGAAESPTYAALSSSPVVTPITFSTNAAGLPLLTSREDGGGLKVFLDFDGYGSDTPFTIDTDGTTFNTGEQAVIYRAWRDIVSFFSMLDVNITTVQPPTGGNNPVFVWQRIVSNLSGGAAYVGWLTNNSSQGYNNSGDASGRTSGIAHEIGHQLNLNHQSDWSNAGVLTAAYTSGWDQRHGPIMGVDYAQTVKKWINGRTEPGADAFQDDLATLATFIAARVAGSADDGYMPDDFTGTGLLSATALSPINGAFQTAGSIERMADADYFSFTSSGQTFNINVEPTFESGFVPKVEVYDGAGNLIAAKDDAVQRAANDNHSMDVNLFLPAGTYVVKVASHGDYGDLGEYAFYASPLPEGWYSADVRNLTTGRGGYVTYDAATGTFHQGGSGADIWTTTDAFRFTYQILTGSGSITARVTGLDNTDTSAKAGLMVRESLAHNSKFAMINFTPGGSQYVYRSNNGGSAASGAASLSMPNWIRLSRAGNVITLSQSTDGVNWTAAGSVTLTSLTSQVYIGLVTGSHNIKRQATATFTNVAVSGLVGAPAPLFNELPAPAGLAGVPVATQTTGMTLTWDDGEGETGYAVERSTDGVTWAQVSSTGAGVTTYNDDPGFGSMRWWYRVSALNASGKSIYSAPVSVVNKPRTSTNPQAIAMSATRLSLTWRDTVAETGYRVERSTDGGANYITVATLPANINSFNNTGLMVATSYTYRITPLGVAGDGVPLVFTASTPLAAPASITLTAITTSSITVNWTQVAGATGYTIFRSLDGASFTAVGTASGATTLSWLDSGRNDLTPYYYYVQGFNPTSSGLASPTAFASTLASPALTAPWQQTDIGSVAGAGQAGPGATLGSFIVNASGNDIAGTADSFRFVYQAVTGDTQIIAQVASISNTATAAKAGVMIRQDLSAGSKFTGIFLNQGGNYGIDLRTRVNANAAYTYAQAIGSVVAPYYLKLTRAGNTVTLAYSADGSTFTTASTINLSMAGTVYVGLAVTAFSSTRMNQSTFANVQFGLTPPAVATPATASPTPVTGTTTNLSVLGADNSGEATLIYTWSATGPGTVSYSANGTNAAKNAVATFSAAGTYNFTVTISDQGNLQATSSVAVTVEQTLTGIGPVNQTLLAGTIQQMSATDQFGSPMSVSGVTWTSSAGIISSDGRLTAPLTAGAVTVTGDTGAFVKSVTVNVVTPRAWYKNDAVSGVAVTDSSGNNSHGTNTGGYSYGAGLIGNALTFSGGHATLPTGLVSTLNDFTISGWVRLTSKDMWARVFDFGTGTGVNMFLTPVAADGYLRFAITTGGGSAEQRVTSTVSLNTGTWYFLAVTLSGTLATLYLNGTAVGSNALMTLKPSSLGNTTLNYLGKSQYADPTLKGAIDDFRIYNVAAPAATVVALYAAGIAAGGSAPTNVTATASSTGTWVDVDWMDNSQAEIGYLVERATNAAFTTGLTPSLLPANSTVFSDTSIVPGTTYYYRVTTLLAGNTSIGAVVTGPVTPVLPPMAGDANNDRKVDAFDLNLLAANWQAETAGGISAGDFNGDGKVDAFDLNVLAANWQQGVSLTAGQAAEPFYFAPSLVTTTSVTVAAGADPTLQPTTATTLTTATTQSTVMTGANMEIAPNASQESISAEGSKVTRELPSVVTQAPAASALQKGTGAVAGSSASKTLTPAAPAKARRHNLLRSLLSPRRLF